MIDYSATFIFFFAAVNPIASIPLYLSVTKYDTEQNKKKIALEATLISAAILLFFIIMGEIILAALGVPLAVFQIAGGLMLFLFALRIIFSKNKTKEEIMRVNEKTNIAIFPLAIPSIATPEAMLIAVMSTDNTSYTFFEQFQTSIILISVLISTFIVLLFAKHIQSILGKNGVLVIGRILRLIVASTAIAKILDGIKIYFLL